MRTVDKGGVHIEQCLGCGGVFLDRGEMEAIARAEAAFYGGAAGGAAAAPPPYNPGQPPRGHADSPRPYRGSHRDSPRPYGHGHQGHRKKNKGFLDNVFGF